MAAPLTTSERRAYLLSRRDTLRAEQAQRDAQRKRAEDLAAFMARYGDALARAGVQYDILWPEAPGVGTTYTLYPVGFASIKWDLVPHARRRFVGQAQEIRAALDEALADLGLAAGDRVIVDWAIGGMPRIRLRASDLSTHAALLLEQEAWVYDPQAPWLIELHHDGYLTHADRPGLPEHAGDSWRPVRDRRPL